eukprot:3387542-Ditylum_brightwellii.AAC.1
MTKVIGHPEAHLKRRCSILESNGVKSSIIHDVDVELSTELMMDQSLPTSHEMHPPLSNMSHVPVHIASNEAVCIGNEGPVNLGSAVFEPLPYSSNGSVHCNIPNICMKSLSESDVNGEIRRFLVHLMNE